LITFVVDHAYFADPNALVGADKTLVDTVLRSDFRKSKYSTVITAACRYRMREHTGRVRLP
jgi:hypothetical protein